MQLPLLTLPRAVPMVKDRPPQDSVPQTKEQRELVRTLAQRYVAREKVVIPLSLAELQKHANKPLRWPGWTRSTRTTSAWC